MSKNIVLLSDGTGNSSSKIFKTNVWRLYQALDLTDSQKQIAYYDDGVGTSSFKPFAILGGVFGFGLKRNVIDIYSFCCRNYRPSDKIYGFGFSRGAFTIRVVAGFIARIGLVRYEGNEADLARDAEIAYREYRKARNFRSGGNILIGPLRALRDWVSHIVFRKPSFQQLDLVKIEKFDFLGVWDTVDAYGGPIEEITRAIDYWYWPLSMPDQFMNHRIARSCGTIAMCATATTSCMPSIMTRNRRHRIPPKLWRTSTASASARCGSLAFTPTSAADIRGTVFPIER